MSENLGNGRVWDPWGRPLDRVGGVFVRPGVYLIGLPKKYLIKPNHIDYVLTNIRLRILGLAYECSYIVKETIITCVLEGKF